jgi:arylsulfatase A-like enzyme/Tfp pilus assembly protein PilF
MAASPTTGVEADVPNVVVITIDTVRADHLGCYGDRAIQTPNIDELARASARFTHAFTPVPITLPAHSALFTGSFPMATGMHDFGGNKLAASSTTLAKVLRDHDYSTAAFLGAAVLDSRFGLNQGFETYFDHFAFNRMDDLLKRPGDQVTDNALAWLKTNPRRPFFVWVHLYDAHYPYTPPEPFASRYPGRPYDGEIAFVDVQVGRLMAFLKESGAYAHALIVLAADHGEGLGEHGESTHGFFIYNSTLHVPLLIKIPGTTPVTIASDVSLVDVMPTILQALTLPIPPTVQGRSLLGEISGKPASSQSNLYAETYLPLLHFGWSRLRAFASGGMKYIDAPRPELYNTRLDPEEKRNLFASHQAAAHDLRDRLEGRVRQYTPATVAGKETQPIDPVLADRLRSLGYVAISGTYSEEAGKPRSDPKDHIRVYELFSQAMEYGQNGHYRDALAKLHEAETIEPALLAIRFLQALEYYRLKDYPRAIEGFKAAVKLDPKYAYACYYLGLTEAQIGNLAAGQASLRHALELDPTNFLAAYDLGTLELQQNHVPEGVHDLEQAVQASPEFAQGFEALGEGYLYLHRNAEATRALERAVAIAPRLAQAHYYLGVAYRDAGRADDAQREFARARASGGQ